MCRVALTASHCDLKLLSFPNYAADMFCAIYDRCFVRIFRCFCCCAKNKTNYGVNTKEAEEGCRERCCLYAYCKVLLLKIRLSLSGGGQVVRIETKAQTTNDLAFLLIYLPMVVGCAAWVVAVGYIYLPYFILKS